MAKRQNYSYEKRQKEMAKKKKKEEKRLRKQEKSGTGETAEIPSGDVPHNLTDPDAPR